MPNNQSKPSDTDGLIRLEQTGNYYPAGDVTLEKIFRSRGVTDPRVANAADYWGVNYLKTGDFVAPPKIGNGYIFFTRPRLRLTQDNLRANRTFMLMKNTMDGSVANIVRAILDPVGHKAGVIKCSKIDQRNPFISFLTNNCKNSGGWPETVIDPYTSRPGLMGETISLADGYPTSYGSYTLNATFRNVANDAIGFLFHVWTQYAMLSHIGRVMPYKDDWLYNRINYNTRVYRLVTEPTGTYIVDWNCTGASFPLNAAKSGVYDYDSEQPVNQSLKEVSIQFQSNGAMTMDPIVFRMFNQTVINFCPQMAKDVRNTYFHRLTIAEKPFFSNLALPFIDLETARLDWYVDKIQYQQEMKLLGA